MAKIRVIYYYFGHTEPMCVLPYGVQAEIDCDNRRFLILEAGVTGEK